MKRVFLILSLMILGVVSYAQVEESPINLAEPEAEPVVSRLALSGDAEQVADSVRFQPDTSLVFAVYDNQDLAMDVYFPADCEESHACVIFAYGGGFMDNNQKAYGTRRFCRSLADDGYVAIAMDYRLGLKDFKSKGLVSMIKPLEKSMKMATEDMFKAVEYVLANDSSLKVDPDKIILCGSSAGAMTSLQTDYELCNRTVLAINIPEDFRFAGVISFSGAIFSTEGKCDYKVHDPAPTFFLHGASDRLVTYRKIAFLNLRLSGADDLVKRFKKNHYSYKIMRFVDEGHGVSVRQMDNYSDVIWFMENMALSGRHFEIDETVYDRDKERTAWDSSSPAALYGN